MYCVTVTNNNGCTDSDCMTITVNQPPPGEAGPDESICKGDSATLTATGGTSYSWSNGQTTTSITVSPTTTTTYVLTANNSGVTSTDEVIVIVNGIPSLNAGPDEICENESSILTATGTNTYSWSNGLGTGSTKTVNPLTNTTYYVTGTDLLNGCTGTTSIIVNVNASPTASAGTDKTISTGSSTTITASGGTSYTWDNGKTGATITENPTVTTMYCVTVTNNNGCTDSDCMTITVNQPPPGEAGPDESICKGDSATLTATGGTSYSWSNGQTSTNITVSPTTTTTYTLTIDNSGVTSTDEVIVIVNGIPSLNAGPDEICENESSILTATGTNTYSWSNGLGTGSTKTVNPLTNTTYYVTGTDLLNGCTGTTSIIVNVNANPTASAGADKTITNGNSTIITASGGTSYTWNNGKTGATITENPTVTTTYCVTVTNNNGCTDSDCMTVVVGNSTCSVIANAGVDKTICTSQSANITASGGTSYSWSNGQTTASITVTPFNTTTYIVTVDDGTCSASDFIVVTVSPFPSANAGIDKTICKNSTVAIVASGGDSYSWSNATTNNPLMVTPISNTTYRVTVTKAGCTAVDDVAVYLLIPPTANAGGDQTICYGQTADLNATGNGSYIWSTGNTQAAINVQPLVTSTYTITVYDTQCLSTDNVIVFVNPIPIISIDDDMTVCSGSRTLITADGGGTYSWTTGATTKSIIVYPITDTVYKVTVKLNGCSETEEIQVSIQPVPDIDAGENNSICVGENITLIATGNATSYKWNSQINNTITVSPDSTKTYYLEGELNNCQSYDSVIVFVNQKPVISIINDTIVCEQTDLQLYAQNLDNCSYSWTGPNGFSSNENNPIIYAIQLNQAGIYNVTPERFNCIGNIVSVNVGVKAQPEKPVVSSNSPICEEETLLLFADSMNNASYQWTSTSGYKFYTQNVEIYNATTNYGGVYSLRVIVDGCASDTANVNVEIKQIPIAFFFPDVDSGIRPLEVKFTNSSFYADYYYWMLNDKDSSSSSSIMNPTYTYNEPGQYTVQLIAYNSVGCTDTIYYSFISVENSSTLYIPSSFTPNDDGDNDMFMAKGTGIDTFEGIILDRWGEIIFTWNDITSGWDGNVKGKEAPIGVYLYKINAKGDNKVSYHNTGTVTLVR